MEYNSSLKMRVLWLSNCSGLYHNNSNYSGYHGGGWISSLQKCVISQNEYTLGFAFTTPTPLNEQTKERTLYYPIYTPPLSPIRKIRYYYGGYKQDDSHDLLLKVLAVIEKFKPDIIHLFGLESTLAVILGNTSIPIVVHVQGLLAPCSNAFFPVGINKFSFLFPPTISEWVFRNGFIFANNQIKVRGRREIALFKKTNYFMGRTDWDWRLSRLLAPQSKYFHVDEVLRDIFYKHAGEWKHKEGRTKYIITSTISSTMYKGLDMILKTAALLKSETDLDFEWRVIGLSQQHRIVKYFEKSLDIISSEVSIKYMGIKDEVELCDILLDSNCYVHPSYIDNSPNSLCEAMLLGLPVLATFVGGVPTLLNYGKCGILVPANEAFELAYEIQQLLKDRKYAEALGEKASCCALQRHDKIRVCNDLFATYKIIISDNEK